MLYIKWRIGKIKAALEHNELSKRLLEQGEYFHKEPPKQEIRKLPGDAKIQVVDSLYDEATDTQAFLFRDQDDNHYIVFRGTDSFRDWRNNIRGGSKALSWIFGGGVGHVQFNNKETQEKLKKWSKIRPKLTVTGHSLGGAIAQYYIAHFPDSVSNAVLFNSAGVDQVIANTYEKNTQNKPKPELIFQLDTGDIVSNAGGVTMLKGKVIFHDGEPVKEGWQIKDDHTAWMLAEELKKKCKYYPKDQFNEFLRQRTAARTQNDTLGILKNTTGYVIESELIGSNGQAIVDVIKTGIHGTIDVIEDVINKPSKDINKVLDILEKGWEFFGKAPSVPRFPEVSLPRPDSDSLKRLLSYLPHYDTAIDPEEQAAPPRKNTGGNSHEQPPLPAVYIHRPPGWGVK